jgi:tRNA-dihydrouridine synthase
MVTSRALVERNEDTMQMVTFAADEKPRSVQLYGVSPNVMAAAVKILIQEDRADHIDLNMGCPVPKVTRKGGGAALPFKRNLFREIVRAAVQTSNSETLQQKKELLGLPCTLAQLRKCMHLLRIGNKSKY